MVSVATLMRPSHLIILALIILFFSTCFVEKAEAKNKAGKAVKTAAKAYVAHKTTKSIWKMLFVILGVVIAVVGVVGCFYFVRRQFAIGSSGEGFGLLREGP